MDKKKIIFILLIGFLIIISVTSIFLEYTDLPEWVDFMDDGSVNTTLWYCYIASTVAGSTSYPSCTEQCDATKCYITGGASGSGDTSRECKMRVEYNFTGKDFNTTWKFGGDGSYGGCDGSRSTSSSFTLTGGGTINLETPCSEGGDANNDCNLFEYNTTARADYVYIEFYTNDSNGDSIVKWTLDKGVNWNIANVSGWNNIILTAQTNGQCSAGSSGCSINTYAVNTTGDFQTTVKNVDSNTEPVVNNVGVNQSVFNEGMYIWANVTDIDNNLAFVNFTYTLPNGTIISLFNATSNDDNIWNSTFFIPDDGGNYSITIESYDEYNENTTFISSFVIDDTVSPTVVVTLPINNTGYYLSDIAVNFSLNDDKSQNINLNCWYEIDESGANTSISNCENFTLVSLGLGEHNLTLYANDSFGNIGNGGYYNFSALNDTSSPSINLTDIQDLTSGDIICTNKNVTFTYAITDNNVLDSCWLNVYDGTSEKIGNSSSPNPIDCNGNESSFVVSGCSAYDLNVYANDTYSNEGVDSDNFTLSYSTSPVTASSEGGSTPEEETIKCDVGDVHWEIKPRSFNTFLGKNSYRERLIEITNNGTEEINFNLNCDDTSITNFTKNSCQFVNISANNIKVEPNIEQPEKITVRITTPEEAEFYDSFSFGVFFTDNQACSGTVSFINKVTIFSGSFYKIGQIKEVGGLPIPIVLPFLLTLGIFTFIGILGRKIFFFLPLMMFLGAGLGFLILVFI